MEPLAVLTRNNYVESIHSGLVCVTDSDGKIIYSLGDPNTRIYFRSAAKPLQVIPLLQSGAAKALNYSLKDIAIACASHSGQQIHQQTVTEILGRLEIDHTNLRCGTRLPYNKDEREAVIREGRRPTALHCSCSGKHAAMLALARYRGYDLDNYEKRDHPVQQEILKVIADFAGEDAESIPMGIDGCGAPIYLLPVHEIACSYAKLVKCAQEPDSEYHNACRDVFIAMTRHPEMVSGDNEFCTELIQAAGGRLIGKIGSEAVYCLGVGKGQLGICVKIGDGNERAVYPVVIHLLNRLGVLPKEALDMLEPWYKPVLKNNLGEDIGNIVPVFDLGESGERVFLGRKMDVR